jgi:hypothetical protein
MRAIWMLVLGGAAWGQSVSGGGFSARGAANLGRLVPSNLRRTIPATYFGLHVNKPLSGTAAIPWPSVPFGSLRLWDMGQTAAWPFLNPASGTFTYTKLDAVLQLAKTNNMDIVQTLGRTPTWASSNATDQSCAYAKPPDTTTYGECWPATDVDTTDATWKAWVTDITGHVAGLNGSAYQQDVKWEIWNEFPIAGMWSGTNAQLATLTKDASAIVRAANPNWMVLSPASVNWNPPTAMGVATKLAMVMGQTGVAAAVDVLAIHTYMDASLVEAPENVIGLVDEVKRDVTMWPQKEMWNTEFSWGGVNTSTLTDVDMHKAFLARSYLLLWSQGATRSYWYGWDIANPGKARLWAADQTTNAGDGTCVTAAANGGWLCPEGVAYQQLYQWMVGNTMTRACDGVRPPGVGVWSCELAKPGGTKLLAVWDTGKTCAGGSCTTANYSPGAQYTGWYDVEGNLRHTISGGVVAIGAKPILLEAPGP